VNRKYTNLLFTRDGSTEVDRIKSNKHTHTHTQSRIKTLHKKLHAIGCNLVPIKSMNNVSNYIVTVQLTFS